MLSWPWLRLMMGAQTSFGVAGKCSRQHACSHRPLTIANSRVRCLLAQRWLRSTLDQLSAEYLSQQPGSDIVVNKLTEVLLVELIRLNFGRGDGGRGDGGRGDGGSSG